LPLNLDQIHPRQHARSETEDCFIDDDIYGDGTYNYDEMPEPFSSSEDEDESMAKRTSKLKVALPLPRRRIRTLSGTIPPVGYAPVWGGPTMCLGCLEFFDVPKDTDKYAEHLLKEHKIVINDMHQIVDLKRYIEYWRHRFAQTKVAEVFSPIVPAINDKVHGAIPDYYLMSEKVAEDMKLRERLALRRLEEVLSCQQREREDRTFNRACLFCRYRVKGNRAKLIHHLFTIHHLNLGSPDNLVFINEYLDTLRYMLESNQCLYCEKFFPDHNTLMDHMRKKQHREVNPKNCYYDKFYVINYLELGKKWLDVLAEDFEDTMPTFADSEDEEEEEAWNEWQEDNDEEIEIIVMCLFCDHTCQRSEELHAHLKDAHQFDLHEIVKNQNMTYYRQVKLVNFIRKQMYNRICYMGCERKDGFSSLQNFRDHIASHAGQLPPEENWMSDEYLIPNFWNDYLLVMLDDPEELPEAQIGRDVSLQAPAKRRKSSRSQSTRTATLMTGRTSNNVFFPDEDQKSRNGSIAAASSAMLTTKGGNVFRRVRPTGTSVDDDDSVFGLPPSAPAPSGPVVDTGSAGLGSVSEAAEIVGGLAAAGGGGGSNGSGSSRRLGSVGGTGGSRIGSTASAGGGRRHHTSSSGCWRDCPIIPEDLPEIGEYLRDPAVRADLM
jgi:hypothetical protein